MITPFSFLSAAEIRFGRGQASSAIDWLAGQTQCVLLVHGASAQRSTFLIDGLQARGITVFTLAIDCEPTLDMIEQGVLYARRQHIEMVVSLGGGAVIDAGKAIAALVPARGDLIDYLEVVGSGRALDTSPLPFIAIPTTAGTGSEVTKNAVITVPSHQRKVSLRDNRMLPRLAIIDPALTDNSPRSITLASGLDALTQVIEPWICNRPTPLTDALCQDAIPRAIRALIRLMEQECPTSRDEMAWVSLCGGLALANAGLGVVHGLAGPLGGVCHVPHGAICGVLLPFGLTLNHHAVTHMETHRRIEQVRTWLAQAFNVAPESAFDALRDWSRRAGLGSLRSLGVPHEVLAPVAGAAATASSMKANPVQLTHEQLLAMLQAAWE